MAGGKGCKCAAYDQSECACDADWTPQELIDARAEIERLRFTDAEREAVERAIKTLDDWQRIGGYHELHDDDAATLRGLLERHCPASDNGGKQETTPESHSNQSEGSVRTR